MRLIEDIVRDREALEDEMTTCELDISSIEDELGRAHRQMSELTRRLRAIENELDEASGMDVINDDDE